MDQERTMDATPTPHRARSLPARSSTAGASAMTVPAAADVYLGFGSGRAQIDDRLFGSTDSFDGEDTTEQFFLGIRMGRHMRFEFGRADLGYMADTITI